MSDYLVYIGTYSSGDGDGIHVYRLDMATGALAHQSSIGGIDNPSFLDIAPNRHFLYAIGETAAHKVLKALDDRNAEIPSALFNCQLVLRQSC